MCLTYKCFHLWRITKYYINKIRNTELKYKSAEVTILHIPCIESQALKPRHVPITIFIHNRLNFYWTQQKTNLDCKVEWSHAVLGQYLCFCTGAKMKKMKIWDGSKCWISYIFPIDGNCTIPSFINPHPHNFTS